MIKNISIVIIDAPVEKIWDTLTEPELVKLWQYGSELITNWKVGSNIRFRTEWEEKVLEQWGKVLKFKQNELIRYHLFAPRPGLKDSQENYFIMNYILSKENGKTKLKIIQEDPRPGAVQEEPQDILNPILKMLKEVCEG